MGFRGSRGDTQGKPDGAARETLSDVPAVMGQLVDIRKRSFIRFVRESELPIGAANKILVPVGESPILAICPFRPGRYIRHAGW